MIQFGPSTAFHAYVVLLPLQEQERVAPELERAEDAITEARREVGKIKRRVDEIMDRAYAAFSK